MATDKEKGIVDSTTGRVRETTSSLRGEGPWHSANSKVYHNYRNYQTGNSIAPGEAPQRGWRKP